MNLFRDLVNLIYPPRCPVCWDFLQRSRCGKMEGSDAFCADCFSDFRKITPPLCTVCGRPYDLEMGENHLCEACLRTRPFYDFARAPYLYEGTVVEAIHAFKYAARSALVNALGPLLAQYAQVCFQTSGNLTVMPVPLHLKRLRERGFNQSLLLAKSVAKSINRELDFLSLWRVKYTRPQTDLGINERRKNVRGAFQVRHPDKMKGKTILLVDDVATTGNTLNEASRALKKAGCKAVFCLVLARTGTTYSEKHNILKSTKTMA